MTEAESCWDDSLENDETCERYLRQQKEKLAAKAKEPLDDDASEDIDEDEEEESEDEEASVDEEVTAEHDADAGDDDDDEDADDESEDEDDDPENVAPEDSATATRGRKMARTKADGSKTKAESIREVIEAKRKAGADLRPRDIIEALNKRGVEVNASQVSITLRSMGIPPSRKGPGSKKKPVVGSRAEQDGETEKRRATMKRRVSDESAAAPAGLAETEKLLDAAANFMHVAGGYEQASKLLNMCNKLSHRD